MDCVFDAFVLHVEAVTGERPGKWDHMWFRGMRRLLDRDGFTHGSIAPWIVEKMARKKGLKVRVQTANFMTQRHWVECAPSKRARVAAQNTDYEYVDPVNLEPAIYLMWGMQHAVFSYRPPRGIAVVAIQLYKESE